VLIYSVLESRAQKVKIMVGAINILSLLHLEKEEIVPAGPGRISVKAWYTLITLY
jgi:hypothetical protein